MTTVPQPAPPAQPPTAARTNPYEVSCISVSWDQVANGDFPKDPEPPTRRAFRDALAVVAARAKEALPKHAGRIDSAAKIVLADDLEPGEGGRWTVGSATDAGLRYIVDGECSCRDSEREEVAGWCKHHLAVALLKRTRAALAVAPTMHLDLSFEEAVEESMHMQDNPPIGPAPEPPTPETPPVVPVLRTLELRGAVQAEAPYSATFKAVSHGFEVLVTVRKTDTAEFLAVLSTMPVWLAEHGYAPTHAPRPPRPAEAPKAETPEAVPSCPLHGSERVKRSTLFAGWYCASKITGTDAYCKFAVKD